VRRITSDRRETAMVGGGPQRPLIWSRPKSLMSTESVDSAKKTSGKRMCERLTERLIASIPLAYQLERELKVATFRRIVRGGVP
jgi:hypothetical protein